MDAGVKIVVTNHAGVFFVNFFVSHLPDAERSAFKETFNSVYEILEIEFWACSILRFYVKNPLFNSFIGQILLKTPVQKCSWFGY